MVDANILFFVLWKPLSLKLNFGIKLHFARWGFKKVIYFSLYDELCYDWNILRYDLPQHCNNKSNCTWFCLKRRISSTSKHFVLFTKKNFLKTDLTNYIGILYDAVWYTKEKITKNISNFFKGQFQNKIFLKLPWSWWSCFLSGSKIAYNDHDEFNALFKEKQSEHRSKNHLYWCMVKFSMVVFWLAFGESQLCHLTYFTNCASPLVVSLLIVNVTNVIVTQSCQ